MRTSNLTFPQPSRRVYTATKKVIQQCGQFKRIECNDRNFTITAKHGMSLLSFGENVTIHVVATSTQETEVRIESASRLFLNFINGGANKKNIQSLKVYIRNEVNKLCRDEEIGLNTQKKCQNQNKTKPARRPSAASAITSSLRCQRNPLPRRTDLRIGN